MDIFRRVLRHRIALSLSVISGLTAATLSLSDRAGAENKGNSEAQSQDRRSTGRKSLGKTERGEVFENPNGTRSLVTWVDPADGQPTSDVKAKGKRGESESGGKTVSFAGDADEAETKDVVTVGSADEFFRLKLQALKDDLLSNAGG